MQLGDGGVTPLVLNLVTRWRFMVGLTPWSVYSRGKCPSYPLNCSLGGPQSQSGSFGEETTLLPLPRLQALPPSCSAHSLVTVVTMFKQIR